MEMTVVDVIKMSDSKTKHVAGSCGSCCDWLEFDSEIIVISPQATQLFWYFL